MFTKCGHVKLIDFGVALKQKLTMQLDNSGTPLFMAPEHFRGETCPASDIWSLGVTIHNLVTGDFPFLGSTKEATQRLVEKFDPDFPEDVWIS